MFTLGFNPFSDRTIEEFAATHNGLIGHLPIESMNGSLLQTEFRYANLANEDVPDSVDWRDYCAVTRVKYQGSCGMKIILHLLKYLIFL